MTETPSALSQDIHLLGDLLGQIIREQHGDAALELVENVRLTARNRRDNVPEAAEKLSNLIEQTTLDQKQTLIKAFSNYFQLINIAEDQHRVRVLRERERKEALRESIERAIRDLKERGLTSDAIRGILQQAHLRFVLTAHPSEAKRKEILIKLRHLTQMMTRLEREELLPRETKAIKADLAAEIEELWQTRSIRSHQTFVSDEVNFGLYFVTGGIMDATVDIYDTLEAALNRHYPDANWRALPEVLQFASWIGGDRDGNPNVTTDVTLETLKTQRATALQVYRDEIKYLREHLTQAVDETTVSEELHREIKNLNGNSRFSGEPYRQFMDIIGKKLKDDAYPTGADFLKDLRLVYESLIDNRGGRVAKQVIRRLIRKVELFGLHLLPLEVREDAGFHADTIHELFAYYGIHEDYHNASEEEKQRLLTQEIANARPLFPAKIDQFSETTRRIIETWRMIATAHDMYGTMVIDTVIASMSKQPSDVLAMLLLSKEVGIDAHVDIAPLFETIQDLYNAADVMTTLFQNETYKAYLEKRAGSRGLHQQIMIGYSDSSKDGGYLASNWHLYAAQQKLTEACEKEGVLLELFHGRGGSIGRGGGPTNRSIRSQPPLSLRGGIKITEQGEVIAYRYSNSDIAHRHLQQVMNAVLISLSSTDNLTIPDEWAQTMEKLSEYSRQKYRHFVYEEPGFLDYWQAATPVHELGKMRISSRPAKRTSKGGFAAMRAIPWVFSWMQSRAIVPSWFGIGTACQTFCDENEAGLELLQTMYQEWAFFRAVIDNAQLDVAKADMGIAELYASLVQDDALRDLMFGMVQTEHSLSREMILKVTQQEDLLSAMPAIKVSIERRNPYVDPLNFIQVALLPVLRDMDENDEAYPKVLEAVLGTINGIAAGMKTTG